MKPPPDYAHEPDDIAFVRTHQTRLQSMTEAVASVLVGYVVALATQLAVFPLFGLTASFLDNVLIAAIFTVISVVRSYTIRRLFEGYL